MKAEGAVKSDDQVTNDDALGSGDAIQVHSLPHMPDVSQVRVLRQRIDQIPIETMSASLRRSLEKAGKPFTPAQIDALISQLEIAHAVSKKHKVGIPMATLGVMLRETMASFLSGKPIP